MKKAYFIGIAGKTMAPLAKAFKDMGWDVSGSDQENVYPPITTYLDENKIPYVKGYSVNNVPNDVDMVVVGYSALLIDKENPEYLKARELNLKIMSYPEVIGELLIKTNSVVVAGTYGKTTISSLVAWIFIKAGLNPSYMTGGIPIDLVDGVKITDSSWSAIEGDEVPSLLKTDPAKFMFYRPKYVILTATKYDHPEIYKTEEDYLQSFIKFVELIPEDGLMVYNLESVEKKVVDRAHCKKVSYSLNNSSADYNNLSITTKLLGKSNLENVIGVFALCIELGIDEKVILEAIASFRGVKTRLELLGEFGGRLLYWDFAQHPEKVKGSLTALREHYPDKKIICIYDPVTTGLKYRESLEWFNKSFTEADQVIVGKVSFLKNIDKKDRVTGADLVKAISLSHPHVFYEAIDEKIVEWLLKNSHPGDVIVFMSSGGLDFVNLIEKVKEELKRKEGLDEPEI